MADTEKDPDQAALRLIRKYPNRRLYDTHDSVYIRLDDLRDMVINNISFRVEDSRSGEDITRSVLLQVISEQESEKDGDPLFSTDHLRDFIRYGQNQQQMFSDFMTHSLAFFHHQQEQFSDNMKDLLGHSPMKVFSDISRRNMEMWQQMQESFYRGSGGRDHDREGGKHSGRSDEDPDRKA